MNNLNIVTVIQARTGSSRLPQKVMMDICGKPLLLRMVERVQLAKLAGKIVVATSTNPEDNVIENLCREADIACFRGHPTDLLDRHYQTGLKYNAEALVKIPSDCPLIDPKIIDRVIGFFSDHPGVFDYVSNLHPATYPDGNDVEIMPFEVLQTAWEQATKELEREHTTPYIWENPDKFQMGNVVWETGKNFSASHRWTIDYEEDYRFIKRVYEELYPFNPSFGLKDILALLDLKPGINDINKEHTGRYWYENHLDELKNIDEYKKQIKKKD